MPSTNSDSEADREMKIFEQIILCVVALGHRVFAASQVNEQIPKMGFKTKLTKAVWSRVMVAISKSQEPLIEVLQTRSSDGKLQYRLTAKGVRKAQNLIAKGDYKVSVPVQWFADDIQRAKAKPTTDKEREELTATATKIEYIARLKKFPLASVVVYVAMKLDKPVFIAPDIKNILLGWPRPFPAQARNITAAVSHHMKAQGENLVELAGKVKGPHNRQVNQYKVTESGQKWYKWFIARLANQKSTPKASEPDQSKGKPVEKTDPEKSVAQAPISLNLLTEVMARLQAIINDLEQKRSQALMLLDQARAAERKAETECQRIRTEIQAEAADANINSHQFQLRLVQANREFEQSAKAQDQAREQKQELEPVVTKASDHLVYLVALLESLRLMPSCHVEEFQVNDLLALAKKQSAEPAQSVEPEQKSAKRKTGKSAPAGKPVQPQVSAPAPKPTKPKVEPAKPKPKASSADPQGMKAQGKPDPAKPQPKPKPKPKPARSKPSSNVVQLPTSAPPKKPAPAPAKDPETMAGTDTSSVQKPFKTQSGLKTIEVILCAAVCLSQRVFTPTMIQEQLEGWSVKLTVKRISDALSHHVSKQRRKGGRGAYFLIVKRTVSNSPTNFMVSEAGKSAFARLEREHFLD
jgi:hypothetical protein